MKTSNVQERYSTYMTSYEGPKYEDIDITFEYLDMAKKSLGMEGIYGIFKDLENDNVLKHVNLSYNISPSEVSVPEKVVQFIQAIGIVFRKNKFVIALDLAGNHLFDHSMHPSNEHLCNYVEKLTDALLRTGIKRIDVSDNTITGPTGRMLKGLGVLMRKFMVQRGEGFSCRFSKLHSQGFQAVSDGLGIFSPIMYLDLSDNYGGIDPTGRPNSEGILALAQQISQCQKLHSLKLARNKLREEDIITIANGVRNLPQFRVLDLSGNDCHILGSKAIKEMIISHSILGDGAGIRDLDLSSNPIGDKGAEHICEGIRRTETLSSILLNNCNISESGLSILIGALAANGTIINVSVNDNQCCQMSKIRAEAEASAVQVVQSLRKSPQSIDTSKLTTAVYSSLAKKLRFLDRNILEALYSNPSFVVHNSEMQISLFELCPPPRHLLLVDVKGKNEKVLSRLEKSNILNQKLHQAQIIYAKVMVWYEKVKYKRSIERALKQAEEKMHKINTHNEEDDIYSKYAK